MFSKAARRACCVTWLMLGIAAQLTASAAQPRTILVMGDSLSAAFGMSISQGWVALLEQRLRQEGYGYDVVNASASGETTAGGRARLGRALAQHRPSVVILELGGNDGLRGLPVSAVRSNLEAMITQAKSAGADVLLLGMRIPPNYGEQYSREFSRTFAELARKHDVSAVEFFLDKVAMNPRLMQDDQIHPAAQAQPLLLDNVWPQLQPLLTKHTQSQGRGG